MSNNMDIWAIQNSPNELEIVLKNLSKDSDLLLYTNLTCNFSIGNTRITSKLFDTALYSEKDNILILIMLGSPVNADDLREALNKNFFTYNEISFSYEFIDKEDTFQLPEIWFANDVNVIDDAFSDSINKGSSDFCYYFPFLSSEMSLSYYVDAYRMFSIDNLYFKGLIVLDDKIILISENESVIEMNMLDVNYIVNKYGMQCIVLGNSRFDISKIYKKDYQLLLD